MNKRVKVINYLIPVLGLAVLFGWTSSVYADEREGKSGVTPQVISLPSGPGSLEGLGESFEPDLSTGTASYPVELQVPPGVNGLQPELRLTYSGGKGATLFGMAWSLNIPYMQRQTDAGFPTYDDEQDTFIYSSAEELVSMGDGRFRFENENEFMRFTQLAEGGWTANTPDGRMMYFGTTEESTVVYDALGIFRWHLERVIDVHGNQISYSYEAHGNYKYIKQITYNVSTDDRSNHLIFEYETRPDSFTDYSSLGGLELTKRVRRIDVYALNSFVRAYEFVYGQTTNHSLLKEIVQVGQDDNSTLPKTTFNYTDYDSSQYEMVEVETPPPIGIANPNVDLVDINYDSLPDLVFTDHSVTKYYINKGDGKWESNPHIGPLVAPLSSSSVRLSDMDGDGLSDLLVKSGSTSSSSFYYLKASNRIQWDKRVDYYVNPSITLDNPNIRLFDANNDKRVDMMLTTSSQYYTWLAHEDGSWSTSADFVTSAIGPSINFANPHVQLADMTGDRLQDLVYLQETSIIYFTYQGNGRFDSIGITMQGGPLGISNAPTQARLGDINNDGLSDIILPGHRSVRYWLNQGDDSFAEAVVLQNTPPLDSITTAVRLADMDGDGASELLFSELNGEMAYVDFHTGTQPNLLATVDNGLGRTTEIFYEPSTTFYTEDWNNDAPWQTTIPFPVQVVSRVTVRDANSGDDYVTDYRYRDGYYDGEQKEFRGFAEVVMTQYGDESAPTTITHHIYDTGANEESRKGLLLEQTVLGVGGACADMHDECYRRDVHTPTTQVLHSSGDDSVRYSYIQQTDSYIHEQQATPVHLRQTMTHDPYGNMTEMFDYGQVCDGDVTCGDDERLQYTQYAINEEKWLIRNPSRMWLTDENDVLVSESRYYYDGADYVGLPVGDITHGNLTRKTDSLGALGNNRFIDTQRQAFDSYGNVVGMKDANGNLTTVSYDGLVHTFPVAERIHLEDSILSFAAAYDFGFGKVTAATDFNGNALGYEYDVFGRITKIVLPGDTFELPTQQFSYDLGSPRSSITTQDREQSGEAAVRTSVVYFDGLGRALQTRREAEDGQVAVEQATLFNARQSAEKTFLPYYDVGLAYAPPNLTLPHMQQLYDPLGRTVQTTNPDGTITSVVHLPLAEQLFDEEDNRTDSPHFNTPKTLMYDGLERLIGVDEVNRVDGVNETYETRYSYDLLDNLTGYVDAAGNVKTQQFDALSRKLSMDDPDTGVTTYSYDDVGNLLTKTDAKGQTIRYAYDWVNRPITETWVAPNGSETVYATYHYDGDLSARHPEARNTMGQLSYIEDQVGNTAFSYDPRGNVIGQSRYFAAQDLDFVTLMTYDATDRLTTMTYPDGRMISYSYNRHGLLEQIPNFVNDIDYLASGQLASLTLANGATTEYDYDNRLRVVQLQTTVGANVLQDLTYQFDGASNIVNINDGRTSITAANDQTHAYQYDALYRLIGATGTYGSISYAYSSIGNMIHKSSTASDARLSLGTVRYGENGAGPHTLTSHGNSTRQYDLNGNLIAKDGMTLTWDTRNQVTVIDEGSQQSSYLYDANGQRAVQTVTGRGITTTTLYVSEYSELRSDEWVQYVFDGDKRVAEVSVPFTDVALRTSFESLGSPTTLTGETRFYVADHLGGTSLLINEAGQIESEIAYYPYGLQRYAMGADGVPYQYTGQELDATGLNYYGARYYDSVVGGFISADPLIVEDWSSRLSQPNEHNLYAYVLSNPLNYTDPSGLESESFLDSVLDSLSSVAETASSAWNTVTNLFEGSKMATGEGGEISGSAGAFNGSLSTKDDKVTGNASVGKDVRAGVAGVGEAGAGAEAGIDFEIGPKKGQAVLASGSAYASAKAWFKSIFGGSEASKEVRSAEQNISPNFGLVEGGKDPVQRNAEMKATIDSFFED